jgi:hypothetical protein
VKFSAATFYQPENVGGRLYPMFSVVNAVKRLASGLQHYFDVLCHEIDPCVHGQLVEECSGCLIVRIVSAAGKKSCAHIPVSGEFPQQNNQCELRGQITRPGRENRIAVV